MKLRCALVLFLAACVCSFGQSASTILSSLRIKGATSEGGDPKYENYVPRLDTNGTLSLSILPPLMYTNIYSYINEHGSEFDQSQIRALNDNIDNVVARQLNNAMTNIFNYVDTTADTITNSIPLLEKDGLFHAFITNSSVAIGYGASCSTNNAYQIGSGTNNTENTLQFMSTVLVGQDGTIPRESVPWAAVETNVFSSIDNLYSNKVSIYGDKIQGRYEYSSGDYAAIVSSTNFVPVNVHGLLLYKSSNATNAEFVGEIVIDDTADTFEAGRYLEYIRTNTVVYADSRGEFKLDFACFGGSVTNTINFSVNEATCTVTGTDLNGFPFECKSPFKSVVPVKLEDVFVDLFKHLNLRNPSGIRLRDIAEPVDFFEMKTKEGKIYRYSPREDGSIIYTRVK